ncbi:hypothetical protein J2X11_000462 [Aeromicrobium panaciterrae]|uniref:LamG domain-containing protein n=1 Tax=Aeromicrobium panaciterrae TaxID=363861 RepID=A0ABU1UKC3_9ACTN|nr:hypothetical protein [Aeromicrobium panaciterrae]MDR7085623.1 hypothetical protein [Aeromicrobium panaciterrae]
MRKSTAILSAAVMALATAVTMSPAEAASYDVSASISTSSAQSGDGPFIKGSISPAHSGKTVLLERYYSGAWHTLADTSTNSSGRYGVRLSPDDLDYNLGSMKFRARLYTPNTGKSSTVTKTIYGWRHLAYMTASSGDSLRFWDGGGELTVDGVYTDEGWHAGHLDGEGIGYTKWNLQEKCIRLQGFAGLDDDGSSTGAIGKLYIGLDGTSHDYDRTFDKFEYAELNKSLYKTHYMTFKSKRLNLDENTVVGVGYPRVLCSKDMTD